MKLELRKVTVIASMSEETTCFTADLYIDGVKTAHVENTGKGGSHMIRDYPPGKMWDTEQKLDAYAKTLPDKKYKYNGEESTLKYDADLLVSELLTEHMQRKEFTDRLKRRVLFTCTDKPGVFQDTAKNKPSPENYERVKKCFHKYLKHILNELPFEEAFVIYKENVDA